MKKFIILFFITVACNGIKHTPTNIKKNQFVVSVNGNLSIQGRSIVNEKGEIVSFAGNSFFWSNDYYKGYSFYNKEVVAWLKKDWNTTIIRIPVAADPDIHDSYIYEPKPNMEKLEIMIQAAIDNDVYIIVDWHTQKAEQNEKEAILFFKEIATKYGKYPNIIYEIYNEPLKISWSDSIKPYAINVITEIRKIDPDNIIVVGTPHWSQDVDVVAQDPISGFKNIAYTLHFYAGSHHKWLLDKAQKAIDLNLPIIVTEWGTVNADGDGVINYEWVAKWMEFMKANNLTHCNWSVHDKAEGASILQHQANVNGNWEEDDLTETGKLVKSYILNW